MTIEWLWTGRGSENPQTSRAGHVSMPYRQVKLMSSYTEHNIVETWTRALALLPRLCIDEGHATCSHQFRTFGYIKEHILLHNSSETRFSNLPGSRYPTALCPRPASIP